MSPRANAVRSLAVTAFRAVGAVLGLLMIAVISAHGQSNDDQLAKIEKSLKEEMAKELSDWTCHPIQPIQGSAHVIIYHCELGDILVKIAVTEYSSLEGAESLFKETKAEFKRQEEIATRNRGMEVHLVKEELSNLGDEGYVRDVIGSEAVAFRNGKFLVDISVPRPNNNKDVFFSRKFAQHVAKALLRQ